MDITRMIDEHETLFVLNSQYFNKTDNTDLENDLYRQEPNNRTSIVTFKIINQTCSEYVRCRSGISTIDVRIICSCSSANASHDQAGLSGNQ